MDRRTLLRGTLAAPVVMTVTPALGAARTTFMACADHAAVRPVSAIAPSAALNADEWLRIDLDIFEVSLPNEKGEPVLQPGRYFVGPDKSAMYRLADVRPEAAPPTLVHRFHANTLGLQKRPVEKRRALAYVDRNGEIVGYAWQRRGGAHITASCYASVMGGLRKARIV